MIRLRNAPESILNPFYSECVESISMYFFKISNKWIFKATVTFINGNTKAEQTFKANSAKEVYRQLDDFLNSLNA